MMARWSLGLPPNYGQMDDGDTLEGLDFPQKPKQVILVQKNCSCLPVYKRPNPGEVQQVVRGQRHGHGLHDGREQGKAQDHPLPLDESARIGADPGPDEDYHNCDLPRNRAGRYHCP